VVAWRTVSLARTWRGPQLLSRRCVGADRVGQLFRLSEGEAVPSGRLHFCVETDDDGAQFLNVEDMARTTDVRKSRDILSDESGRALGCGTSRQTKPDGSGTSSSSATLQRQVVGALSRAVLASGVDLLNLVAPFLGDLWPPSPQTIAIGTRFRVVPRGAARASPLKFGNRAYPAAVG